MLPSSFTITSNGTTLSAIWVGENNDVQVRKVYHFDTSNLYFKTSVSVKNISPAPIKNLYCKLLLPPSCLVLCSC